METSCVTGEGVEEAFMIAARTVLRQVHNGNYQPNDEVPIRCCSLCCYSHVFVAGRWDSGREEWRHHQQRVSNNKLLVGCGNRNDSSTATAEDLIVQL